MATSAIRYLMRRAIRLSGAIHNMLWGNPIFTVGTLNLWEDAWLTGKTIDVWGVKVKFSTLKIQFYYLPN